ncbi:sulfite exporter TauE/SafE family protein [Rhizorhabdus dicambivorans]|uniref:sulfite exporter TauE/SafE family protein n=1 Tax=Rhizorhabdus dicambivorans TaxID=1850238 RepID=UPI000AE7F19E|nr:sulfite exporter TauE/SafE family protein [Rhizorhabdus dicambivorans]
MDFSIVSPAELVIFACAMIGAGLVGGVVAGMLGVGGGIVIVPVLYYLLGLLGFDPDVQMHVATGTSLATIIPTSFSSIRSHNAKGAVDHSLVRSWMAPMVFGVLIGSIVSGFVGGHALAAVFGIVALPVAIHLVAGREPHLKDEPPRGGLQYAIPTFIGTVSTMMGIGGGTVGVPIMTMFGFPIHRAVGTASVFGAIISVPGTIGAILAGGAATNLPPASLGYVNLR